MVVHGQGMYDKGSEAQHMGSRVMVTDSTNGPLVEYVKGSHFPTCKAPDKTNTSPLYYIPAFTLMAWLHSIALLAGWMLASSTAEEYTTLGGYTFQDITSTDIDILVSAMGNTTAYNEGVTTMICLVAAEELQTQVVAGTNYKFVVAGCAVEYEDELGACYDRNCAQSEYEVVIYSVPWEGLLQVTSIIALDM